MMSSQNTKYASSSLNAHVVIRRGAATTDHEFLTHAEDVFKQVTTLTSHSGQKKKVRFDVGRVRFNHCRMSCLQETSTSPFHVGSIIRHAAPNPLQDVRRMTLLDQQFLLRVFHLLQDCGMPDMIPERSLMQELYWMFEEHFEQTGLDPE